MITILRTLAEAWAEMLGGRWVGGRCAGCGRRAAVQYEAFDLNFWDRQVVPPYRCRRCLRGQERSDDSVAHLAALRPPPNRSVWRRPTTRTRKDKR